MKNIAVTMQGTKAIPAGYKQTELGVIPDDWEVMLVGEAFAICNNLRMPISSTIRDGMNGDYPYYGPTKIQGYINEYRVMGEYALIGEDGDHFLKYESVPQTQLAIGKFNVNNHAHLIKEKIGSAQWFYWFFRNRDISIYLTRQGAGRFKLNKASLQRIPCIIPPIAEQASIANVLSDSEKLIDAVKQLISKKQAIKTATMQQLLSGRTRLSQFAKHPDGTLKGFTSSELGLIPEDWIISPLSQIGRVLRGVSYNGSRDLYPHDTDDSVRLFRSNNIYNSKIDLANLQYVTKTRVAHHQLMNGGDILICMANGSKHLVGKAAIYNIKDGHKYTFGAFMGVFRTFTEVESLYAFYLLTSDKCRCYIDLALAGSSINNLKPSDIEQFTFALPNSEEQKAIATILSDMDAELEALEQKLAKVLDLKQGMMQQLLTGRIRLPLDHQP